MQRDVQRRGHPNNRGGALYIMYRQGIPACACRTCDLPTYGYQPISAYRPSMLNYSISACVWLTCDELECGLVSVLLAPPRQGTAHLRTSKPTRDTSAYMCPSIVSYHH